MKSDLFLHSYSVLKMVLDENVNFSIAMKNISYTKKLSLLEKNDVSALVGSSLRHYLVFLHFLSGKFPNLDEEVKRYSMLYLANRLFVKRLEEKEIIDLLKKQYEAKNYDFDESLFNSVEASQLIDETLDKSSIQYLSLRNNIPEWLIKMWSKQYGERIGFLLTKNLHNKNEIYCNVNENVTDKESFLNRHNDFVDSGFQNNVHYVGKGPIKGHEAYINNEVFLFRCAEEILFEKLEIDPLLGIAVLGEEHTNVPLAIASKKGHLVKMEIVSPDTSSYYKYSNDIKKYDLRNTALIKSSDSLSLSLSESKKTLILTPANSQYSLLQSNCDYFIKCQQNLLDGFIANQKKQLEECAGLVSMGGQLVYLVHTVDKKETHFMILDFLSQHPEFTLSFEKQFLPIDKYQSCLYFAILRKETTND